MHLFNVQAVSLLELSPFASVRVRNPKSFHCLRGEKQNKLKSRTRCEKKTLKSKTCSRHFFKVFHSLFSFLSLRCAPFSLVLVYKASSPHLVEESVRMRVSSRAESYCFKFQNCFCKQKT